MDTDPLRGSSEPAGGPSFTVGVVDAGTGLGVLVRGSDFTLVYDAGSNDDQALGNDNRMLAFIREVAPTLTTIEHVILSHPHTDHVLLLPDLFANYQVRHVWDSGRVDDICGYRLFIEAVRTEPDVAYHTAVQNGGTRNYSFTENAAGTTGSCRRSRCRRPFRRAGPARRSGVDGDPLCRRREPRMGKGLPALAVTAFFVLRWPIGADGKADELKSCRSVSRARELQPALLYLIRRKVVGSSCRRVAI